MGSFGSPGGHQSLWSQSSGKLVFSYFYICFVCFYVHFLYVFMYFYIYIYIFFFFCSFLNIFCILLYIFFAYLYIFISCIFYMFFCLFLFIFWACQSNSSLTLFIVGSPLWRTVFFFRGDFLRSFWDPGGPPEPWESDPQKTWRACQNKNPLWLCLIYGRRNKLSNTLFFFCWKIKKS